MSSGSSIFVRVGTVKGIATLIATASSLGASRRDLAILVVFAEEFGVESLQKYQGQRGELVISADLSTGSATDLDCAYFQMNY